MKKALKEINSKILLKKRILYKVSLFFPDLKYLSLTELLTYFDYKTLTDLSIYLNTLSLYSHRESEDFSTLKICHCKDANGLLKDLYKEEIFAQKEIVSIFNQKKIRLKLYSCPYEKGWHLTKG